MPSAQFSMTRSPTSSLTSPRLTSETSKNLPSRQMNQEYFHPMSFNPVRNLILVFLVAFFLLAVTARASDLTSASFIIRDPIIGTFGDYGTSASFQLISSGHTSFSDPGGTSASFQTRYGFLYYQDESRITFDIDTAAGGGRGESSAPYSVGLGTITTTDTRVSGTTDGIQMIVLEGETGAAVSGMVVTVRNANGTNGLVSTAVSTDEIDSVDGTIADGTENYGLCVATSGLTGFSRASPYNSDTCATNSETNGGQALTTTGENILNSSSSPVYGAHAEISVNAAINTTTPA